MEKNKLKSIIYVVAGVILGAVLVSIFTPSKTIDKTVPTTVEEKVVKYYTCSMHPQVRMDHPDQCPICGMDLIPIYEESGSGDSDVNLKLGQRARKLAAIKTEPVTLRKLTKDIYTVAKVDYDETKLAYISAWNSGRIDELYADFTGMDVKKGERLALLYSPELISAQQEYLLTYEKRGANAKSKLLLLGISSNQIKKIEKAGKPLTHITITSPIAGTVIHKNVKKGQYVKTGNLIYTIADLSELWIYLDIYEYDLPWLKVGQIVFITTEAYPDEKFEGKVTFIDPFLSEKTRTVKVRVDVKNPDKKLKPGMFANANIHEAIMRTPVTKEQKVLAVKKDAVLDTGIRKVVYVELEQGVYSMREITTGPLAGNYYLVRSGLKEGEKVVVSGNFLIDSQMQLSGKPSIMFPKGLEFDVHADMGHKHEDKETDVDDMDMDDITTDDMDMGDITMDDEDMKEHKH